MSNHFFSINRGEDLTPSAVTAGTSSVSGDDVELRVADGASLTKLDVDNLIETLQVFILNRLNTTFPPL